VGIVVVWATCVLPLYAAGNDTPRTTPLDEIRREAERCEQAGQWDRACTLYEQALMRDRTQADLRARYLICLRRAQQARRHRDTTFRQQILELSLPAALDVYGELLNRLRNGYVDRDRADLNALFKQGLEELRHALGDGTFCFEHLSGAAPEAIRAFQAQLEQIGSRVGDKRPIHLRRTPDALAQAREIATAAQRALGLRPTLAVLELACGACGGLDEYTHYLTPGQYAEVCASLRGEVFGIGIEVVAVDRKLFVSQVLQGSPAELAGIKPGDRLVRLGKRPADGLTPEAAAELFRGEVGSVLDLEVRSTGEAVRELKVTRQALSVASVSEPRFLGDRMAGVGYLQIVGFQDTTARELDDALLKLQMAGLKVLVLDLRGNPGGSVDAATQVVERFLSEGIIATSQGQLRTFNRVYHAHNAGALTVPLVVLIDGDTASAAELVAGALKEHQRATLVGQTTFGKDTLQQSWRLSQGAAGLRLTVARTYSPRGQSYGTGVTPHVPVEKAPPEQLSMDPEQDPQVRAAMDAARQLLTMNR
jgi:carboxyl-terminal processing protease